MQVDKLMMNGIQCDLESPGNVREMSYLESQTRVFRKAGVILYILHFVNLFVSPCVALPKLPSDENVSCRIFVRFYQKILEILA